MWFIRRRLQQPANRPWRMKKIGMKNHCSLPGKHCQGWDQLLEILDMEQWRWPLKPKPSIAMKSWSDPWMGSMKMPQLGLMKVSQLVISLMWSGRKKTHWSNSMMRMSLYLKCQLLLRPLSRHRQKMKCFHPWNHPWERSLASESWLQCTSRRQPLHYTWSLTTGMQS